MRDLWEYILRVVRAVISATLPKPNKLPNGLATTIFWKPTKPRMPAAWLESDAKIVVKVYHGGGVHLTPSDPYQRDLFRLRWLRKGVPMFGLLWVALYTPCWSMDGLPPWPALFVRWAAQPVDQPFRGSSQAPAPAHPSAVAKRCMLFNGPGITVIGEPPLHFSKEGNSPHRVETRLASSHQETGEEAAHTGSQQEFGNARQEKLQLQLVTRGGANDPPNTGSLFVPLQAWLKSETTRPVAVTIPKLRIDFQAQPRHQPGRCRPQPVKVASMPGKTSVGDLFRAGDLEFPTPRHQNAARAR